MADNNLCSSCEHPRGLHGGMGCRTCGCSTFTVKYAIGELMKLKEQLLEKGFHCGHPKLPEIQQMSEENLRWLYDQGAFPMGVSWHDLLRYRSGR